MASAAQIEANRRNAKKSTGPKTVEGKLNSSRNATRHGLCAPRELTPDEAARAERLAASWVGREVDLKLIKVAEELARAQVRIEQVQTARHALMETFDTHQPDLLILKRAGSMDRLERYALTERRKAHRKFQAQRNLR